ncbi:chromosome transmission fidelity protein 18 homolog [Solanum pennellii]|uniref:Chromosome transmission fidelity protein 18 homolog n=1 Tax=Solanum pennellii TaxID=28526 RepID=A0ABM1UW44_SOLPN|nr:chromosome transmission fidelity protein 18 homolog [Solanum pennellii]
MDMEFPDAAELEWLEANATYPDEEEDDLEFDDDFLQQPTSPPGSEQIASQPDPKPTLSLPPKPSIPKPQLPINSRKRFLPDDPELSSDDRNVVVITEEKRSRVEDNDEDWLRYSPPKQPEEDEPMVVEQELEQEPEPEEKILAKYALEIDGDCTPVTGLDGERVYAKICRVEDERVKKLEVKGYSTGLIQEPVRALMQRVEHDQFTKALEASSEDLSEANLPIGAVVNEKLWVDKYAPSSFTELLSDEQTNRQVLMWLKQWDSCVFGVEIKSTTDDVLSSLKRHSLAVQHPRRSSKSSFGNSRGPRIDNENAHNDLHTENSDSDRIMDLWDKKHRKSGPPEQKILLLCGPPGLGKTTLAHVAAQHCGYRVVEINASDDRSSASIEAKIHDVVQMNSVNADSKPKCLVIDEIDGALNDGKGAVEVILKLVSAERKLRASKENEPEGGNAGQKSSKKKHQKTSLLRPVICICNDLYAPALRPLRQVAKVHIFVQPTVSRVVNRLKYICNRERVKTSSIALTALAEYTDCDIRSCLNTLQFLNKKKETLNVLELSSQVVGRKDATRSAFDIWKEILQKKKVKQSKKSFNCFSSVSNDFETLHSLISHRGDYDLIFDGIHENLLQLHYTDPVMQKTVQCSDILGYSDIFHQYTMRTQHLSLQVYQSPLAMSIHGLVAQIGKPNIEWPKSLQRYRTMSIEKKEILHSWKNKIPPSISRHLSTKSFVEDLISPFLHILSPSTLKPVALHLLSEKEKADLAQLVNTMVSYATTYKNIKSDPSRFMHHGASDASMLSLDPPIGEFINFKGYDSCHIVLASAVKVFLVHEAERQKILQGSSNLHSPSTGAESQDVLRCENSSTMSKASASSDKTTHFRDPSRQKQFDLPSASSQNKRSAGGTTASGKVGLPEGKKKPFVDSRSFFDRFRKPSDKTPQGNDHAKLKQKLEERDSRPLLFKFNEGYTNAVKRPVRIREFLE